MTNHPVESPLTPEERLFMGLVRQGSMSAYMGRLSQLTDDELRSIYALAVAAQREAHRRRQAIAPAGESARHHLAVEPSGDGVPSPHGASAKRRRENASRAPKGRAT